MVNYLNQLENPQINSRIFFEVMRDFRKGGLSPEMYDDFIAAVETLPQIIDRTQEDYKVFDKFNLKNVDEDDFTIILREIHKRAITSCKECWHPLAGVTNCNLDSSGKIIVSAAHSIQKNGVLSKIAEDGNVMGYALDKVEFDGKKSHKNHASIFWGFCNTHDSIFSPIETSVYSRSDEQNFLYAYRGFVVSSHKKKEVSHWINYGEQWKADTLENKKIFDNAIISKDYSVIKTEVFELDNFYPIVVSSAFYLEYDFEGNNIIHSEERMEFIFVTLFPLDNKTIFLLSYFECDEQLYSKLGEQLRKRKNMKSDITMIIAAHTENVYFNPTYYETFIKKHETELERILQLTQFDFARIKEGDNYDSISMTPKNYLQNSLNINFFGY